VSLVPYVVAFTAEPIIHLGTNVAPVPVNELPAPVGDEKDINEKSVGVEDCKARNIIKLLVLAAPSEEVIVKPVASKLLMVIVYGPNTFELVIYEEVTALIAQDAVPCNEPVNPRVATAEPEIVNEPDSVIASGSLPINTS
jgi:hypothetical protein